MSLTQHESTQKKPGNNMELRVAAGSDSSRVAGAITRYLEEGCSVSLLAMGAGAVNQAVKALCIARGNVAPKGWNLSFVPGFRDEFIEGIQKTAICFYVVS